MISSFINTSFILGALVLGLALPGTIVLSTKTGRIENKKAASVGFLLYECLIKHGKFGKQLGTSKQVFLVL